MSRIKELREKSARAIESARAKIDALTDASTAEQRTAAHTEADAFLTEAQGYDSQIATLERLAAAEQRASDREQRSREGNRPTIPAAQGAAGGEGEGGGMSYRSAYHAWAAAGGDESRMSEEARSVLRAGYVPDVTGEQRTQVAGTASAGGYTVPIELARMIERHIIATGPMYDENIVTVFNTPTGGEIDLPTMDDTSRTGYATTEGAALTDDNSVDATVGQKVLNAFMFDSKFVKISPVLAQDSPFSWEAIVAELIGEGLARKANVELTTGSGSGTANGIVTASSLGKTTAGVAAVTADEILEFIHSVDPNYRNRPKSRAMFNDTTLLALRKLKDGQGNYLIRSAPEYAGQMIVGAAVIPYSINQAMASMATGNKFMVFGDLSKYIVRKVGGINTAILRERFWPNIGIAGYIRIDGEATNTAAFKHMKNA